MTTEQDDLPSWWELPGTPGENRTKEQYQAKVALALSEKTPRFCGYIDGETVGQFLLRNGIHGPLLSVLALRLAPLAQTIAAAVKTPLASPEDDEAAKLLRRRAADLALKLDEGLGLVVASPEGADIYLGDIIVMGCEISDLLREVGGLPALVR